MADETTTTWADLLREARGPLVEALRWKTVLLSEVRRDKNPRRWHGKQVTIPIFLSPQQGTSMISESAVLTTPIVVDTEQAVVNSRIISLAVSFSTQVIRQADGDENSWAEVIPTKMERAEAIISRVINEQFCGTGDALLAAVTTGSATAVQTVGTAANFYELYPGRYVDALTRATGAPVASGTGRKIIAVNPTAGTVTFDAAFTTTTAEGFYIQGSYGNALAGLGQAAATTGVFEGIDKTNVDAWKGTDVTGSAVDPSMTVFDGAERRVMQRAGSLPDFYLSDPAVVDKYSQGIASFARWAGEVGQLETGWTGVRYRNKLIIPEFDMPAKTVYGVPLEDMQIYTLDDGPDWDDLTGSMFQRFGTRNLPVEAWLIWMLQLGFHRCNAVVKIGNLNQAA